VLCPQDGLVDGCIQQAFSAHDYTLDLMGCFYASQAWVLYNGENMGQREQHMDSCLPTFSVEEIS